MLKSIKNNWHKAQAAVVIELLFEDALDDEIRAQAAKLANKLVEKAWESFPHFFDGSTNPRPHKMVTAAVTLAMTLERAPKDGRIYEACAHSLTMLMLGFAEIGLTLGLTAYDVKLLEFVDEITTAEMAESDTPELDAEIAEMLGRQHAIS